MAMKVVRLIMHGGRLEPLEPLAIAEGAEVEVTLPVPEEPVGAPARAPFKFRSWKMGVKEPLTREAIYEDVG